VVNGAIYPLTYDLLTDLDIDERILADLLAACDAVAKALGALKPL
jgi:hypothetical protein